MEIEEIECYAIGIPLDEPAVFSARAVAERDHTIVEITASDGTVGVGYTLGYDASTVIVQAVNELLKPLLIGEDPRDTTKLWTEMFDQTVHVGRRGILLRAISIIDIALWDIKAKLANQPLHKHIGAYQDVVPAYASGGYYNAENDVERLREELAQYVDNGHDVVKIKLGNVPVEDDVERVRAARETIGEGRTLLLDATCAWKTKRDAVSACRAFGEYDPYFIEEPVMPDSMSLMSEVNDALAYPVAAGELEATRYAFKELITKGAVDIIQPDVTVVGGVTEWLRIAHMAASWDVPVAPHYNHNLHAHLVAAVENGLWVEYFYRDIDIVAFDDVVRDPVKPDSEGNLPVPNRPGHGVVLDDDAITAVKK